MLVVIPLNAAKEVVSATETTVSDAVISCVVWVTSESGSTSLMLTWLTPEWWAWLRCTISNLFPVNKVPFTTESPFTKTLVITALVSLLAPYWTNGWSFVNFSPWTSVS